MESLKTMQVPMVEYLDEHQNRLQAPCGELVEYLGICIQTEHWQRVKLHRHSSLLKCKVIHVLPLFAQKHLRQRTKANYLPTYYREVEEGKTTQRLNDTCLLDEPTQY